MADMKKKIIRGVAVLAIAGAAGHFVQQSAAPRGASEPVAEVLAAAPKNLETVVAIKQPAPSIPKVAVEASIVVPPLANLPVTPPKFPKAAPAVVEPVDETPVMTASLPVTSTANCTPTLDLLSDDMAMIGVTLIAPCHGDQDFTLRHNGLVLAQATSATGSYFAFIPALSRDGAISVTFKDGQELTAAVDVPALDALRRVSLIWQAPDVFGIQALEGETSYGEASAISAENPQTPLPGAMPSSGYLTRLGDASNPAGLMADIYTYPADPAADTQVLFEAAVTPATCDREVFAEVVQTQQGKATTSEMVMTLPECDGESGFLVLNNPAQDQSIAALN